MNINLNLHKTLEILGKIKMPFFTLFLAFISSFNLWFLSIYFFNHQLFTIHGLVIVLLITFALTTAWCLLIGISVPKYMIWFMLKSNPESIDIPDTESDKTLMNLFVFFEIILVHGFILYLEYLFRWAFPVLISVLFWIGFLQFLVIDILVKSAFFEYQETKKQDNKK